MKRSLQNALTQLQAVAAQTTKFLERISSTSERLSGKNSSTLFGCLGGLGGFSSAYVISLASTASFPVISVSLTAIGIVGGVLFHRGSRRFALERDIEENRLAANEILDRLKNLPKDAPKLVRDELWLAYRSVNGGLHAQAMYGLERSKEEEKEKEKENPSPQLLLPPATTEGELVSTEAELDLQEIPVQQREDRPATKSANVENGS